MQTDVLIVGAGPTGLMLANQLARRGLKPRIIDRHPGRLPLGEGKDITRSAQVPPWKASFCAQPAACGA
jgi:2-polyprenyl-6-methoxyphenol hydroxylase-like FAD-dependent oxidoreductase